MKKKDLQNERQGRPLQAILSFVLSKEGIPLSIVLIHSPIAKAGEPPAGIARLAAALHMHGIRSTVLDLNLEGQLLLLASPPAQPMETRGMRASKRSKSHVAALRTARLYENFSRYQTAVSDINHVLQLHGKSHDFFITLANFQAGALSPQKSDDLLAAAQSPEKNIFYSFFAARLDSTLTESNPLMVGFSLNYLSQAICTFAMIGYLKKKYPGLPIVLGCGLVTSWLRNPVWRDPFNGLIDHMVAGPGEGRLLGLLGIQRKASGGPPDYSGFPRDRYLAPGFIAPYAASSGCYWNKCSFCPEKAEQNPYVPVSAEKALAETREIIKQTQPVLLHLLDNAMSPALMQAFAVQPPGVPWYGFARVSSLLTDIDFCRSLRKSGCVMLKLGIESGDQHVLDELDKGIELNMVSQALLTLRAAGIATYVYLLFGTPVETIREARNTLEFVRRHQSAITFLNLALFNMPVAGPDARRYATSDFYEGDLSLYTDFVHPQGWGRQEVRRFLDQEFKKCAPITAILRRDPPFFTSNHAPFFVGRSA
jgi:hypothetical protein